MCTTGTLLLKDKYFQFILIHDLHVCLFDFVTAKKTGKMTKCWVCNKNFPQYVTKYGLNRRIVNELTVKEAIESVLPEESSGLQGTCF